MSAMRLAGAQLVIQFGCRARAAVLGAKPLLRSCRRRPFCGTALTRGLGSDQQQPFVFSASNFRTPQLPTGLQVLDVPLEDATDEALQGLGRLVYDPEEFTIQKGTFDIVRWPQPGWRPLDPGTGDEAGTTEGDFEVYWKGDYYYGTNLAIATNNNQYLEGLGALPEHASHDSPMLADAMYLWMSDYHPDGGQLFWPHQAMPFVVCLGPAARGDDIKPQDMRSFLVPEGRGIYLDPGTWHNGIYVAPRHLGKGGRARFLTRQGRVHARISASWASEFGTLLRVKLP